MGNSYSSDKLIGIPNGSLTSPALFNIMIHDLSKTLSDTTNLVQYADDMAIWMNVSLRKELRFAL